MTRPGAHPRGRLYLLRFSRPYRHVCHYALRGRPSGAASRAQGGPGSRLLQVARVAEISWTLARTWPGGHTRQRQLKNQGGASRRSPECGVKPRSNPGERKEAVGMKQPPEKDTGHAQGMNAPAEYDAGGWARAQLRDQIQRSGAAPETGQPNSRQLREAGVAPLADLQAEPARTASDHGNGPSTGQQITGIAGRAEAVGRRADEHALAARSVDCECQAQAGVPCGPSGDHLARYLRATQSGALTKDALKDVIAGLDVIAPRALVQPPSERTATGIDAGQAAGQTVPSQIDTGMTADPASAPAHSAPRGRSGASVLEGEALPRGYGRASATCTGQERELEAGS